MYLLNAKALKQTIEDNKMKRFTLLTLAISAFFLPAAVGKSAAAVATTTQGANHTSGAYRYRSSYLTPYYKKMAGERIFYIDDKAFATHKSLGVISVKEVKGDKLFTHHFGGRWFYIDAFKVAKP